MKYKNMTFIFTEKRSNKMYICVYIYTGGYLPKGGATRQPKEMKASAGKN